MQRKYLYFGYASNFVFLTQVLAFCNTSTGCSAGDVVPGVDSKYTPFEDRLYNRRNNKPHTSLPFVRTPPNKKAILRLRNLGYFPVQVTMPDGKKWSNFAQVIWTWYIHYCGAEGLTRTHSVAHLVLLYAFYGMWIDGRGEQWPVLKSIHLQSTNGRRRFANVAAESFVELFDLLHEQPSLVELLTDNGSDKSPPAAFLVAVEHGLRLMAQKSIHTMGGTCLSTPDDWKKVEQWRKTEVREHTVLLMHVWKISMCVTPVCAGVHSGCSHVSQTSKPEKVDMFSLVGFPRKKCGPRHL